MKNGGKNNIVAFIILFVYFAIVLWSDTFRNLSMLYAHSCNSCVIKTRCSTHHRFRLINILHHFVGAEHSTGYSMLSKTTCSFFVFSNICRRKQELQLKIFAKNHLISVWIYCFYMWFVFMFIFIDLYFLLIVIVKC